MFGSESAQREKRGGLMLMVSWRFGPCEKGKRDEAFWFVRVFLGEEGCG